MDGILNINKPPGPTSHDVVALVRRAARTRRAGHAGTLDPAASGVLIVCLGSATRIVEYLMDWRKAYRATAVLGVETDTEDQTGEIVRETDCSHVTREMVESVLPRFVGEIMQVPPMVSAVHHEGRRLYELARMGRVVERAPRPVEVYSLRLADFKPDARAEVALEVECSRGTYIRTLCADIGRALDCGGHMSSLVRTAVGRFRIEESVPLETLEDLAAEGRIGEVLHTIDEVLSDMPAIDVSGEDAKRVANGVILPAGRLLPPDTELPPEGLAVRVRGPGDALVAIGRLCRLPDGEAVLRPEKVFGGR